MGPALSLLPVGVLSEMSKLPGPDRPFAERFQTPPAQARILPIIHPWPDNPDAQDSKILTLISQGFGGVACNVSFDQYTESQEHWEQFLRAVTEAKKAGMALWLYDERGYPSGVAGGLTMDDKLLPQWRQEGIPPAPSVHPEWEAQGRFIADARTTGGEVSLEVPPGNVILVAAYPVEDGQLRMDGAVELSSLVHDGELEWNAPAGEWHVMAVTEGRLYEGTHAAVSLCDKLPYINLLMPEPTKRFLEVTHDRYAEHLADISVRRRMVIASDDVRNQFGVLLLARGAPLGRFAFGRMRGHRLNRPVDEALAMRRCLDNGALASRLRELLDCAPDLQHIAVAAGLARHAGDSDALTRQKRRCCFLDGAHYTHSSPIIVGQGRARQ